MVMRHISEQTKRIAELNDLLRQTFWGGKVMMTDGVLQLDGQTIDQIFAAVRDFDTFNADNDPHGEHDFGCITVAGNKVFWKIDYYDARMEFASPNPADPDVTERVLTIMLDEEY
jgi:hypothetical protein